MARVAERLQAESRSLARVPAVQDEILTAAERSAARLRVLRAAGLSSAELDELLSLSATGLRGAVTAETAARFRRRIALLDGWMGSVC